jgi:hypothetical protein
MTGLKVSRRSSTSAHGDEISTSVVHQHLATPTGIEGRPKVSSSQARTGGADPHHAASAAPKSQKLPFDEE